MGTSSERGQRQLWNAVKMGAYKYMEELWKKKQSDISLPVACEGVGVPPASRDPPLHPPHSAGQGAPPRVQGQFVHCTHACRIRARAREAESAEEARVARLHCAACVWNKLAWNR